VRAVVVEDNDVLRDVIVLTLQFDCGADIVGQGIDGRDGLDVIRRTQPELAVVDLHMPRMSGLELIEAVRAEGLAVRLVAYSADESMLGAALLAGADAAVGKRGGVEALTEAVTELFSAG
jgi:DNA-binding NarL/FixJ family response regulator